jgi:hypothetical protein
MPHVGLVFLVPLGIALYFFVRHNQKRSNGHED